MCLKHFFVDTGERHICVCHDIRSCADQVFCNLHCILRKSKCICISEIRTRVDHSFCHRLLLFRDHNTTFFQFFCDNCKTAPLDLSRQYKFYCACFVADEEVAGEAKERKVTRAVISMEHAAKLDKPVIFAIGNAPTALIRLYELICDGIYRPAFIIGVPVGFVNVEVAKEMILHTDVPCIVNRGRKGGSNVAAAICNALLYEVRREDAAKKVD